MREGEIRAKTHRRFRVTTKSDHVHPIAPNLLQRRFAPAEFRETNRVWASDITYIWTQQGWLYLAVVLDLSSRRVVGWSMQENPGSSLTISALNMALASRRRSKRATLLHHSDRGIQYAASNYRDLLAANRIECSMSRKGDCWDNAVTESFFATLKKELVRDSDWRTRDEARSAVFDFIEVWYNRERKHSALGYVPPVEYERGMRRKAA
jgi:transposase InsO family protein